MNDSFSGTWNIKHPSHFVSLFLITLENFEGIKTKPITMVKHFSTTAATWKKVLITRSPSPVINNENQNKLVELWLD